MQTSKGKGENPDKMSYLEIPEKLVLSAFKKSEDDGYVIRVYNPTSEPVKGQIKTTFKNAQLINMNEEYESDVNLDNLEVGAYSIVTIKVEKQ